MITSSKFFTKSFFTIDQTLQPANLHEICPWNLGSPKIIAGEKHQICPESKKRQNLNVHLSNRGYEISRNSSIKYIQKRLKSRSMLQKSKFLPPIEDPQQYNIQASSIQKYKTIQQKLMPIFDKQNRRYSDSVQFVTKRKKPKRKSQMFPQVTLNQYIELKAKGNGLLSVSSIEEMLEKKRNRKKILEQFGSRGNIKNFKNVKIPRNLSNKSQTIDTSHSKSILSGQYVCAIKSLQLSIQRMPNAKFIHEY